MIQQKITPFLWFDGNAEEAVNFYITVFKNSKIKTANRYSDAGPGPKGSVMTMAFELDGQDFIALNGGPLYKFTEAVSFVVNCGTPEEVDTYWEKLSEGGEKGRCGWLKDKYGLSWQVVPDGLGKLLSNPNPEKAKKAMQAMMQMDKIDIVRLQQVSEQS